MSSLKSGVTAPKLLLGVVGGIASFAGSADAVVTYGNFVGTHVSYQGVSENPTVLPGPTPPALFGPPVISGDTLKFTPLIFVSSSSGGAIQFDDGRLTTNIVPNSPTGTVSNVNIFEGGGWAVGGGTTATTALESLIVNQLFITAVNGSSIDPIVVTPTITFTDTNNGSANVTKTGNTIEFTSSGGFSSGSWNSMASFNIPAALSAAGLSGNVTGLELDLNNQLATTSETSSTAFIDKKFFSISTTPVPEPATAAGMVIAGGGLLSRRRRARNA